MPRIPTPSPTHCAYELVQHGRFARELGMPAEKIAALAHGATHPAFDELERVVLAFTDDVTLNVRASDAALATIGRILPPKQIVEIIMTAGCYRMLCGLLETCGVEIEPDGDAHRLTQDDWKSRVSP